MATMLLGAIGCTVDQQTQLLAPLQGRLPTTEDEFRTMQGYIRRMAHVMEGAPGNIRSQQAGAQQANVHLAFPTWGGY